MKLRMNSPTIEKTHWPHFLATSGLPRRIHVTINVTRARAFLELRSMPLSRFTDPSRIIRLALCGLLLSAASAWSRAEDITPDYHPAAYAIQGATIVTAPGQAIENGTVVVRDGVIESVGPTAGLPAPFDAEVIDAKGMIVYPGFLDLYTTLGIPDGVLRSKTGPPRSVSQSEYVLVRTPTDNRNGMTPEFAVADVLDLPDPQGEERRKLGFTDLLAAPGGTIVGGQSALVSLNALPRREAIMKTPVALHVILGPPGADETSSRRRGAGPSYPRSLMGVVAHLRQTMLDADHDRDLWTYFESHGGPRPAFDPALKTLSAARSKSIPVWWEANTEDEIHRVLDLAEEFGTNAVIVGGAEASKVVDRLKTRDVPVVLRLDFIDEPKLPTEADYRKKSAEEKIEPLRVLADRAAKWQERVANAAVLAKAGVRIAFATDGLQKVETIHPQIRKLIAAGLPPNDAIDALTRRASEIAGIDGRLGTIEPGKLGHLVVMSAPYADEKSKTRYVLIDGRKFEFDKSVDRKPRVEPKKEDEPKKDEPKAIEPKNDEPKPAEAVKPKDEPPFLDVATELDEDRRPKIKTGGNVLLRDVTILTASKAGTIPKGSILIQGGTISAIGLELEAPEGTVVIDAAGMVAMPGIIDTHSHMAIEGGVNELSLSVVPEVRVRDVVSGTDENVYRALAGGTTTGRLLHGSANAIGGQDLVIKHKHGVPGRDLILQDAMRPQGVKFALGENVTRVFGRFPNTRMGVESAIDRAFLEAEAYAASWKAYEEKAGSAGPPPRRDLRLEALAAIVDGSIRIHSHCYRNDEILMLMRVAERHGIRVQSLQHVLEGYKVAPEIAAHGASASTFSDWWAYKIEAYDAIPYNAALMTEAGVHVSIKSDSEELVRHLYLEAAKMVKYGGVTEAQALDMITINPARELGLDHRIGSIEVGKDADIAIFNAHPFDSFARCEMALIDGEVWFQRKSASPKLAPRPGSHVAMPHAAATIRNRPIEIPPGLSSYAIVGATLHPVSGPDVADGVLIVGDGKIAAIGGPETAVPAGVQTIDGSGHHVWPGMVDGGSFLGLFEIGSLRETKDYAEVAQFQPELQTSNAIHPDSELIPVTRVNGVLASYIQPQGGLFAGQGCVINLNGWVPAEMIVLDAAALNVNIPAYSVPRFNLTRTASADDLNKKRSEKLEEIKEFFRKALEYDAVVAQSAARKTPPPLPDPRLAALVPYAKGEKPVVFHAEHKIEILDAIKLAQELKLHAMISGGLDAWKVADALKAADIPVILGGTIRMPAAETDPYDAPYANPAKLHEAGVRFAIRSGGDGADQATAARNLPFEAAMAVAYGLPEAEALKAVTLNPAQLLGVGNQLGSLDVGKRANLVLTDGPLLQVTSNVKAIFIDGKPITLETRQTRLYAKYRRRLAEVRAGSAPLGLGRTPKASDFPAVSPAAVPSPANRR
jgi:imidazolonepropionase-like amidohydrolase